VLRSKSGIVHVKQAALGEPIEVARERVDSLPHAALVEGPAQFREPSCFADDEPSESEHSRLHDAVKKWRAKARSSTGKRTIADNRNVAAQVIAGRVNRGRNELAKQGLLVGEVL
jgi:hypothetical protein